MHESKKGFMHVAAPVHVQPFKLRNYVYRARSMQGKGIRGSEVAQSKMMQPVDTNRRPPTQDPSNRHILSGMHL